VLFSQYGKIIHSASGNILCHNRWVE